MAYRFNRGVTLVELMVTISILAILAAVGIPAMGNFIFDMRVSTTTNEFVGAMNLARRVASEPGARLVTVCATFIPNAAVPTCDGVNAWNTGWIVFVEPNSTGALATTVTAANLLSRYTVPSAAPAGKLNIVNATAGSVTFNSTGSPIGSFAGYSMNVNYDGNLDNTRQVCIGRTGRVRVIPHALACPP